MFKNQPKGLIVAALTNLGERFGFYTMMAVLIFYLQARYGMSIAEAGEVYSWFYFGIYGLGLIGGILADNFIGLGRTIFAGISTMLLGYVLLAIPGMSQWFTYGGLFVIAIGNGLFKGNLQALIGNLYENEKYRHLRDNAFSIFYMFINVGAFFAPSAAEAMLNWILKGSGFIYNGQITSMCWAFKENSATLDLTRFHDLANSISSAPITDYGAFADQYLNAVSTGYNYAFGVAGISMIISMAIFLIWKKHLKAADYNVKTAASKGVTVETLAPKENRERLLALGLVFVVVIFFWMAFHQNGLTLNQFAKDYVTPTVSAFTNLFFDIYAFLGVIVAIGGLVFALKKKSSSKTRLIGAIAAVAGAAVAVYYYFSFGTENPITPAKFQQFNPIFIVAFTPIVVGFFSWLNKKGKEPSTPRKIGYGMILAAVGFAIMMFGSFGLVAPKDLLTVENPEYASAYLLISSYFALTIAELCLSPMGISFVSKVAPPKYKALMQGGWLGATAIGNKLLFVGSHYWEKLELWQLWLIFIVCCMISAAIIFSMMKFLERVTKQ
jgi:POT family proton-dependent oligopeptide transporter